MSDTMRSPFYLWEWTSQSQYHIKGKASDVRYDEKSILFVRMNFSEPISHQGESLRCQIRSEVHFICENELLRANITSRVKPQMSDTMRSPFYLWEWTSQSQYHIKGKASDVRYDEKSILFVRMNFSEPISHQG